MYIIVFSDHVHEWCANHYQPRKVSLIGLVRYEIHFWLYSRHTKYSCLDASNLNYIPIYIYISGDNNLHS